MKPSHKSARTQTRRTLPWGALLRAKNLYEAEPAKHSTPADRGGRRRLMGNRATGLSRIRTTTSRRTAGKPTKPARRARAAEKELNLTDSCRGKPRRPCFFRRPAPSNLGNTAQQPWGAVIESRRIATRTDLTKMAGNRKGDQIYGQERRLKPTKPTKPATARRSQSAPAEAEAKETRTEAGPRLRKTGRQCPWRPPKTISISPGGSGQCSPLKSTNQTVPPNRPAKMIAAPPASEWRTVARPHPPGPSAALVFENPAPERKPPTFFQQLPPRSAPLKSHRPRPLDQPPASQPWAGGKQEQAVVLWRQ